MAKHMVVLIMKGGINYPVTTVECSLAEAMVATARAVGVCAHSQHVVHGVCCVRPRNAARCIPEENLTSSSPGKELIGRNGLLVVKN